MCAWCGQATREHSHRHDPRLSIQLGGRTDLLILSNLARDFPIHLQWLPGAKTTIRIKKDVAEDGVFEAVSVLVALDLLAYEELTDLAGHWQFLWVTGRRNDNAIIQKLLLTDPTTACAAIRSILHAKDVDFDCLPGFDHPREARECSILLGAITRYQAVPT